MTGSEVAGFKAGDRVVGLVHPENPASVNAIRGLGNLSTGVDLPGHTMFGGYAQYVARPQHYWIKIRKLSYDQAAAAMWACSTAHHIVATRLNVRMNDNVLITGASGGMGTATLQLVRLAGGLPIATTRSAAKLELLRSAGAEFAVDSSAPEAARVIREFTHGEGVDGAAEFTGAPALMRLCIDAMRFGGTFCPVAGEMNEVPLRVIDLVSRELNVHGVRASTRNDQRIVVELLEKGRIVVPIHATLPLSQVAAAHRQLEAGDNLLGRIVLHPWDD
jgi:NADPH:quinone reductase-like Zn-dependent oxidoreductase